MNDTTTYLNVENNQHVIVEPCKKSKLIVCPACNHCFDPKLLKSKNHKKNKKPYNIQDGSDNTDKQ